MKPTGQSENGEEKYIRLNEQEMIVDVEKIRKENGWKVKRRVSNKGGDSTHNTNKTKNNHQASAADLKTTSQTNHSSSSNNGSSEFSRSRNNLMTEEHKLMQKLAVEAEMRKREQQAMLQKEALRVLRHSSTPDPAADVVAEIFEGEVREGEGERCVCVRGRCV